MDVVVVLHQGYPGQGVHGQGLLGQGQFGQSSVKSGTRTGECMLWNARRTRSGQGQTGGMHGTRHWRSSTPKSKVARCAEADFRTDAVNASQTGDR